MYRVSWCGRPRGRERVQPQGRLGLFHPTGGLAQMLELPGQPARSLQREEYLPHLFDGAERDADALVCRQHERGRTVGHRQLCQFAL